MRLVRQHKTSKDIARTLGISRFTVDQRLKRACQMLSVHKRTEAALLFAKFDDEFVSERFVYEQSDIVKDETGDLALPSMRSDTRDQKLRGPNLADDGPIETVPAKSNREGASQETSSYSWLWENYYPKGDPDAISPQPRIKWIIQLTIQILVSILILVAIGQVLSTFAHRVWPVEEETA